MATDVPSVSAAAFRRQRQSPDAPHLLDVRTPYEREDFSLGGLHLPLDELLLRIDEIPENWKTEPVTVLCGVGLQSAVAVRLLQKRGFRQVCNVAGGLEAYLSL